MVQDLEILQEIQEWDKEIYALKEALEEIPSELEEMNRICDYERERLKHIQEELKSVQLKQKEKEMELATKEEHVRKYENQLTQVKTNKEYASLRSEITALKADNSLLEETVINLIDQVEGLQAQEKEQKKKALEAEAALNQRQKELEEKANETRKRIEVLFQQKKERIKGVQAEVASLYEQIVVKKHGLAMVKVEGEVCPACQMQLRPQVVNEVKLKERIVLCDNCSRILYSD